MFDVGFQELVLIFIIGLLVLGPERLPKVAAEIGKWVGRARRTATQLRRQLEREIELADIEPRPPAAPPAADAAPSASPFEHTPAPGEPPPDDTPSPADPPRTADAATPAPPASTDVSAEPSAPNVAQPAVDSGSVAADAKSSVN